MGMTMMSSAEGGRIPAFTLGWRMRLALETADISVATIAVRLGYSRSTVSRWLNDQDVPRAVVLDAWSRETQVNRSWLETGEGDSPTPPTDGEDVEGHGAALRRLAARKRSAGRSAIAGVAGSNHRYAA